MTEYDFWLKTTYRILFVTIILVIVMFLAEIILESFFEIEIHLIENYAPEFFATLIGVMLALTLEQTVLSKRNEARLRDIQKVIKKELLQALRIAEKQEGHYIQTQVWDSLINSGDAAKLPINLQDKLFDLYRDILLYNNRTSIIREREKELIHTPIDSDREAKIREFQNLRISITMNDSVLVDKIKQILDYMDEIEKA